MRYFIEQAPDRFYDSLAPAKARAARLSKKTDSPIYVLAEEYDRSFMDYKVVGSIAFYNGFQDAKDGALA